MSAKIKLLRRVGILSLMILASVFAILNAQYPGLGLEDVPQQEYREAVNKAARLWADAAGAKLDEISIIRYSDGYPMPRVLALCRFKKMNEIRLVFFDLRYSGHWWRYSDTNFTDFQNFSQPMITFGNLGLAADLVIGHLKELEFKIRFVVSYFGQRYLHS